MKTNNRLTRISPLHLMHSSLCTAALALCTTPLALATDYTWLGGEDGDWYWGANWDENGVPEENVRGVYDVNNTIIIQNGTNLPTTNVPTWNGGSGGTPRFVIEDGASLSINMAEGGWDGPVGAGTIVTVGAGAELTWGSDVSTMSLMRDGDGTQDFDINGGTFTIEANRLDWGFNQTRFSNFNVDGGSLVFTGTSMFGTRFGEGTYTTPSLVTLKNSSTFSALNANFNGNMTKDDGVSPTLVFDIQDAGSSLTAKFGNVFPDIFAVEDGEGFYWTSSTLGDANLVSTDNEDGTFTVTVEGGTSPPLGPLTIEINASGDAVLTWTGGGVLQSDDDLLDPWTDVDGGNATSPYTVPAPLDIREFYRLRPE